MFLLLLPAFPSFTARLGSCFLPRRALSVLDNRNPCGYDYIKTQNAIETANAECNRSSNGKKQLAIETAAENNIATTES